MTPEPDTIFWMGMGIMVLTGISLVMGLRLVRLRRELRCLQGTTAAYLDSTLDGIFAVGPHGTIERCNRAAERLFGYHPGELLGLPLQRLLPVTDIADPATPADPRTRAVTRGVRRDGGTLDLEVIFGTGGGDAGSSSSAAQRIAIVRDLGDRRNLESGLARGEERQRTILQNLPGCAVIPLDAEGRITGWNVGAERVYGWTAAEAIGQPSTVLYPANAEIEPSRALAQVRASGRFEAEGWRNRKDGTPFWVHAVIEPLQDGGFLSITRDLSEPRRIQEALTAARDQASRAGQAQSRFLAAASHDLRQPVQALLLFASVLETKIASGPASSLLRDMKGSLEALNVLLDALLDVARLDAGTVIPREINFSFSTVAEQLVKEYTPQAEDKGLELRVVPSSAVIRTDPTLLQRILQNFLSNSIRFTSQGRVLIGCRRHGRKLRIEVWDSGIGIPAHVRGDIFTEFFQVGNPERDRTKGLGLGLAIVQRLSRLLRTTISLRSKEGFGSMFAVEVPLVGFNKTTNIVYLRREPPRAALPDQGLVFVIDDEPTVLKGLRLVLEDWGYSVIAARTELEAMRLLNERPQPPDLIIADYRLRGICNGAQVVAQVRDMFHRRIPGILITGDTASERIREANDHGLGLLHKPIQPAELHAAITDCMTKPPVGRMPA